MWILMLWQTLGGGIFHIRPGNRVEEDTDMYISVMVCIVVNGVGPQQDRMFSGSASDGDQPGSWESLPGQSFSPAVYAATNKLLDFWQHDGAVVGGGLPSKTTTLTLTTVALKLRCGGGVRAVGGQCLAAPCFLQQEPSWQSAEVQHVWQGAAGPLLFYTSLSVPAGGSGINRICWPQASHLCYDQGCGAIFNW